MSICSYYWEKIQESQTLKYAETLNNSRPAQRIKAVVRFTLYIVDISTDILVGYDLYQKCHTMYSLVAFMILSLPGLSEGIQDLALDGYQGFLHLCKALSAPIWFLPAVARRLFKNIVDLDDEDNKREAIR